MHFLSHFMNNFECRGINDSKLIKESKYLQFLLILLFSFILDEWINEDWYELVHQCSVWDFFCFYNIIKRITNTLVIYIQATHIVFEELEYIIQASHQKIHSDGTVDIDGRSKCTYGLKCITILNWITNKTNKSNNALSWRCNN